MESAMGDLEDFLSSQGWPVGLQNAILESKKDVAFRFVVVDNSRSMLKRDYHEVMRDGIRTRMYENVVETAFIIFLIRL